MLQQLAPKSSGLADSEREALFKQFQAWEAEQNARAQVRAPPKQR